MEDCGVRSELLHDIMRGSVKVRGDLHQPSVQLNHVHLYFSFNQEFIITKHKTYQLYHFINHNFVRMHCGLLLTSLKLNQLLLDCLNNGWWETIFCLNQTWAYNGKGIIFLANLKWRRNIKKIDIVNYIEAFYSRVKKDVIFFCQIP